MGNSSASRIDYSELGMLPSGFENNYTDEIIDKTLAQNAPWKELQSSIEQSENSDRTIIQKEEMLQKQVRQFVFTYEKRMSILINRLKEIKEKLDDNNQRANVIKQIISENFIPSDEFDNLIHSIVKSTYEAAQRIKVDSARAKLISNSDDYAKKLSPIIKEIQEGGAKTLQEIAYALNDREIRTKNGYTWYPGSVKLLIQKINQLEHGNTEQAFLR